MDPRRPARGGGVAGGAARGGRARPVPTQDAADGWARGYTLGMIDHFPLTIDDAVRCVLANALATRIGWTRPVHDDGIGGVPSDWRERVSTVLRTPEKGHECAIARHPVAGVVALHRAGRRASR